MAINDLEAIFGKPDEGGTFAMGGTRERSAKVTYWRRPDGWIARGPEVGTDPQRYQSFVSNRRWRQLPGERFGVEVAGANGTKIFPPKNYPRGEEHRWLEVFFEHGGLTYIMQQGDPFASADDVGKYLMPTAQLVSLGLHRRPDVVKLRPDLEQARDVPCPYGCIDEATRRPRVFGGASEEEAQESCNQHIVAVHKDTVASRAMGETVAKAMQGVQGQQITPELIAQIAVAVAQAMKGPETAAVAATALENKVVTIPDGEEPPGEVAPEFLMPEGAPVKLYGTRKPQVTTGLVSAPESPQEAAPPPISRQEIDSMSRGELISWASKNRALFKQFPVNPVTLNREEWKRLYYETFYPELLTS